MLIIPDTSVWIPFFGHGQGEQAQKLARLIDVEADVCVCGPTIMETLQGIRFNEQHHKIAGILQHFQLLEADQATFRHAAHIYRTCRAHGITVRSSLDCLIAATALQHDAYVLHHDRDFEAMGKHFPLKFF
jgi:predicted nucleic acid-binding protein